MHDSEDNNTTDKHMRSRRQATGSREKASHLLFSLDHELKHQQSITAIRHNKRYPE
jgi:hypothetical protein